MPRHLDHLGRRFGLRVHCNRGQLPDTPHDSYRLQPFELKLILPPSMSIVTNSLNSEHAFTAFSVLLMGPCSRSISMEKETRCPWTIKPSLLCNRTRCSFRFLCPFISSRFEEEFRKAFIKCVNKEGTSFNDLDRNATESFPSGRVCLKLIVDNL